MSECWGSRISSRTPWTCHGCWEPSGKGLGSLRQCGKLCTPAHTPSLFSAGSPFFPACSRGHADSSSQFLFRPEWAPRVSQHFLVTSLCVCRSGSPVSVLPALQLLAFPLLECFQSFRKSLPPKQPQNWEGPVENSLKCSRVGHTGKGAQKKGLSCGQGPGSSEDTPGHLAARPCLRHRATLNSGEAPVQGQGAPPNPRRPDGGPPYSQHRGRARQHQADGPCRGGLARDRQDAEMALVLRGIRPHGHHRDSGQPQAETQVQDPGRRPSLGRVGLTLCPVQGLGPPAARRSRRGVGATSSQRRTRPSAPTPVAQSCTCFNHRRGLPTWTQVGAKRGKQSRITGVGQSRPRVPGKCRPPPGQGLPRTGAPSQGRCSHGGTTHSPGRGASRKPCIGCGVWAS
ncbi:uncharacterized protein LOC131412688 [Diceros bicornis minor]|uniref:uncharacterized protein LOC131412688 n=1 Tax=Diceros bicornis minor TaxID=77932 RepID=UPI0026F004F0|nr:uncharacterized protein LOC131412688 [Diceros bicornis minor]